MKKILISLIILFSLIGNIYAAGSGGAGGSEGEKKSSYDQAVKLINSGKKNEKKGKKEKAEVKYEKALKLLIKSNEKKPNKPDTLNYMGFTSRKLGDYKNAEKYLGELYVATNRHNLAVERLEVLKNCNCEEYEELKAIIAGEKVSKY